MVLKVCIFLILAAVVYGKVLPFTDCGSEWEVKEISIDTCTGDCDQCILKAGTEPQIFVKFIPKTKPEWSSYTIVMKTDGVNFPLPDSDPCNDSGLDCSSPFVIGTEYEFHKKIPIDNATANGVYLTNFVVADLKNTTRIVCFDIKVQVQPSIVI